jgi:hypothetical protein
MYLILLTIYMSLVKCFPNNYKQFDHLTIDDNEIDNSTMIIDLYPTQIQLNFYREAYEELRQVDHYNKILDTPKVLLRIILDYVPDDQINNIKTQTNAIVHGRSFFELRQTTYSQQMDHYVRQIELANDLYLIFLGQFALQYHE